jgi:DNA polymerase elongation subunit (family B)
MIKSKALILDIETSPILAYIWEMGEQHVAINQIKEDWYIMAWSAKWLGDPESKVIYYDLRNHKNGDDKPILKPLWDLLNEADIVITQNGQHFDSRKINARFIAHEMNPPKPYQHIDTYRLVKRVAAFTSNKLEYLTDKLCKNHKKIVHGKFPGLSLWIECLKGNKDAWNEMKRYNIKDILSTEELYLHIKAWAPDSMPKMYPMTENKDTCHTCGYFGEMRKGRDRIAKAGTYTQNSCPKCGSWQVKKQKKVGSKSHD